MKANEAPQQYINKSDLVAEIEKLYNGEIDTYIRYILDRLKSNIDTLEVKEVDLDKEIESYFKGFGKFASVGIDDCIAIAKHFFELGMAVSNKQIEEKKNIDSLEEKCNTIYKDITMIDKDGNTINAKIEQREKV